MYELNFNKAVCKSCENVDCLTRCQYLNYDVETARREREKLNNGEDSIVLYECATCYACEEYCPYGNHPFYQLVELQEQKGILPAPKPIINQQVKMFSPKGDFKPNSIDGLPLNLCLFPNLRESISGKLFENVSVLMSRDLFCNLVYLHFAKNSLIKERVPEVIENLKNCNIKELVCFHDECYGLYASWAPAYGIEVPFKPIHLFEYLSNKLNEYKPSLTELGYRIAYQRPCSSRLTPEKEHFLDEIFELTGVNRVSREYDRENALCCGTALRMQGRDELADELNRKNVEDMVDAGADICIFNCPMCYSALAETVSGKGIKPLLISDLCRMAAGEEL